MKNIVFGLTLLLLFLTGCSQKEVVVQPKSKSISNIQDEQELSTRMAIIHSALKHLNKSSSEDCSGFIALVNRETNETLYKSEELYKYFDNTSRAKAIFNMLKDENRLVTDTLPKIGDIVFFSDTLQKNKRVIGAFNITHIGIVTEVDDDGTVHFIHNIQGSPRIDQLNIEHSNHQILSGKNVNSFLKRCPKTKAKNECLSSFFFSAYGSPIPKEKTHISKN
ncbi:MAG TPA: CHAP domain-containing protein [Sulfurimonas sp.]|uniref:C40 family peptidase n=1 Tax=Sulfurimonas sp. TaxID=2022749 RepID=UPI002B74EFD2|nr:CHAP domain-containing protein [Sulfurimonas sp.]HUH42084.1 CHAP domain-containing protein [Sulfurimonas sp.]